MKIIQSISFIFILFISGCASISGGPEPLYNFDDEIEILKPSFNSDQILTYFALQPNSVERVNLRNQIVSTRLYALDLRYSEFIQELAKELRGGAFSLDLFSLVLSGTATAIDHSTTAKALTGVDTILKGGRQSFSKQILIDSTLDILLTQMNADRKKIAAQMWHSLANRSDALYPLPLALTQLEQYYQAGTIAGALTSLEENAALKLTEATTDFDKKVIKLSFGGNKYSKILDNYVNSAANQTEQTKRLAQITTEIKSKGETILAPFLIKTDQSKYRALQKSIVESLKLEEQ